MTEQKMETKNNKYIFSEIVINEKDIVGMIAYSLYKFEKQKFIVEVLSVQQKCVTKEELDKYQENKLEKVRVYKDDAANLLTATINDLVSKEKELIIKRQKELEVQDLALKEKEKTLSLKEKEINQREKFCKVTSTNNWWDSWWGGIVQSLIASLIWPLIVLVIIKTYKTDFMGFLENILKPS